MTNSKITDCKYQTVKKEGKTINNPIMKINGMRNFTAGNIFF